MRPDVHTRLPILQRAGRALVTSLQGVPVCSSQSFGLVAMLLRPPFLRILAVVTLEPLLPATLDAVIGPLRDHQVGVGVLPLAAMHGQRIGSVDAFVLFPVAGVGAGQRTQ